MHKNTEINSKSTEKRLQKASQYVNDLWFPVNSELLAKIKLGIRGGIYELDPESLVHSISGDFSLFMYCLRELMRMIKEDDINLPLANPVEVLRQAGIDRLKQILEIDEQKISKHSFERQEDFQKQKFEELMISSSTAQALSTSLNINQEIGFSAAILRQLGHTLIAWNYPTVYKEALDNLSEEKLFDHIITEKLGFSPTLLSIRVLMDWGMPVQFCEAVFIEEDDEEYDDLDAMMQNMLGGNLAKICSIGETLARANFPQTYPTAQKDWETAKHEITKHLGDHGMQYIQELIEENMESYITFMPEVFNPGLIVDPELNIIINSNNSNTLNNPYIQLCKPEIAEKLIALYRSLTPNLVNEEALSLLVNKIIPSSGFVGGLIYTIDPGISMLVPQTEIGRLKLRNKELIDYSLVLSNADSVSVAFRSSEPVIEFQADQTKDIFAAISGIIGYSNRVGVLYLEIPYNLYVSEERDSIILFRAFSKTITDCLALK